MRFDILKIAKNPKNREKTGVDFEENVDIRLKTGFLGGGNWTLS